MTEKEKNEFRPDYAISPGEILVEYLENIGMTQAELSDRMGMAAKTINEIVKGKSPITPETSIKLEKVFGRPAHFWNNLDQHYQEDRARIAGQEFLPVPPRMA